MDMLNSQEKKNKYKELTLSVGLNPSDYIPWLVKSLDEVKFHDSIEIPQHIWYHSFIFL